MILTFVACKNMHVGNNIRVQDTAALKCLVVQSFNM